MGTRAVQSFLAGSAEGSSHWIYSSGEPRVIQSSEAAGSSIHLLVRAMSSHMMNEPFIRDFLHCISQVLFGARLGIHRGRRCRRPLNFVHLVFIFGSKDHFLMVALPQGRQPRVL